MFSGNTKTSSSHILLLNLWDSDKISLKRSDEYVALSNLNIFYIWKNTKKSYKNNKFRISVLRWGENFESLDISSKNFMFLKNFSFRVSVYWVM